MASELSELRAELWRTRDDLERMKSSSNSRTPRSANHSDSHSSPRLMDRRRHHDTGGTTNTMRRRGRNEGEHYLWEDGAGKDVKHAGKAVKESSKLKTGIKKGGESGEGWGPGRARTDSRQTSPPTSGESMLESDSDHRKFVAAVGANGGSGSLESADGSRRRTDRSRYRASPGNAGAEAEATLCDLELEGVAFKNWTEEASSIAVRLIEEVKALRWERDNWRSEQATAARAFAELRTRADELEQQLTDNIAEGKQSHEALIRAQNAEREQARVADRAKADLRAVQERDAAVRARELELDGGFGGTLGRVGRLGAGGLREQLRREKEGADALQRRLDAARAKLAGYERERKEWRESRARLEELRRSWGKQLKKVAKKMRTITKESVSLKARVAEAERARDRADAETFQHRETVRRLSEQRDNLLLGATRAGHASSPAEALAELLAAAAAGVTAGAAAETKDGSPTGPKNVGVDRFNTRLEAGGAWDDVFRERDGNVGGGLTDGAEGMAGRNKGSVDLAAALEQAEAEAKLARVAAQQERLKREGAGREKDEAVRQLHRLMGAARRAVGRRDTKLRSSRLETEVVWNALTQAVRE